MMIEFMAVFVVDHTHRPKRAHQAIYAGEIYGL